jgi:hypothetical protein
MYLEFEDPAVTASAVGALEMAADETLCLLLSAEHREMAKEFVAQLQRTGVSFYGAVVPQLIHDGQLVRRGLVMHWVRLVGTPRVVSMDDGLRWMTDPIARADLPAQDITVNVLVDFQGTAISALLEDLYDRYAEAVSYFGAGVGTGVRQPLGVVFCNDGIFSNAAVIALMRCRSTLTVRHGWERIDGPFVATKTHGNVIDELDWEPATELYRRVLGDRLPPDARAHSTVGEARRFPLGIASEGVEDVVRDPLYIDEVAGSITCLSDVPQHSVMHILQGRESRLLNAVNTAVADLIALSADANVEHPVALVFDCMSRDKALGDCFPEEFERLRRDLRAHFPDCEIEGALGLGEIGCDGSRRPELHNKSLSLGLFYA